MLCSEGVVFVMPTTNVDLEFSRVLTCFYKICKSVNLINALAMKINLEIRLEHETCSATVILEPLKIVFVYLLPCHD